MGPRGPGPGNRRWSLLVGKGRPSRFCGLITSTLGGPVRRLRVRLPPSLLAAPPPSSVPCSSRRCPQFSRRLGFGHEPPPTPFSLFSSPSPGLSSPSFLSQCQHLLLTPQTSSTDPRTCASFVLPCSVCSVAPTRPLTPRVLINRSSARGKPQSPASLRSASLRPVSAALTVRLAH